MWIITQTGFLSAVQATDRPTTIVVRARVEADLEPLQRVHEAINGDPCPVVQYDVSDYPFRVLVNRETLSRFLTEQVDAIDYGNFKGRVAQVQGWERENVYHEVWATLGELEGLA